MNFLRKQNFMRPLIQRNVSDSDRMELYRSYINNGQKGDPYGGLINNWWEVFLGLDSMRASIT